MAVIAWIGFLVGVALAPLLAWTLKATRWGLMLRLAGESEEAAAAMGYSVARVRLLATTAGGVLFHGETGGDFAAVDAKTGKTLWSFRANDSWRASPMTYMLDGKQYVAAMDSTNLISFALPD